MSTKSLSAEADPADVTKEQLIRDFKVVVANAEALLKATSGQTGEAVAEVRSRASESLAAHKARTRPRLFAASLAELSKDRQQLSSGS